MGLPTDITPNTTCDIAGGGVPATLRNTDPVPIYLQGAYDNIKPTGTYTHYALMGIDTDIRTDFQPDTIYVPSYNGGKGTLFTIVHIQRLGRGTPADRLIVYLNRSTVNWPSTDL